MASRTPSLATCCFAEFLGTFLLIFFGCGSVHTAVLLGAQSGVWQVAIVWGIAVMISIFSLGGISGAHINPAMTIALATHGRFAWGRVVPYVVSQTAGAFVAASFLFLQFGSYLEAKELEKGIRRGEPGSEITACCYGEYYPNPGNPPLPSSGSRNEGSREAPVSEFSAFLAEVLGTLVLALVVFAITDPRNDASPPSRMAPVFIGLTVAILISVFGPLTQACFNPARDFGPRLFAFFAGWGNIAIPGPNGRGFFTVYILAPILGAIAGGALFDIVLRPSLTGVATEKGPRE